MAGTHDTDGGRHLVRVTLKGRDNETYTGTLILRNLTALLSGYGLVPDTKPANMTPQQPIPGSPGHPADPSGASYYVIAVVLVYGMSIVMLIASHIKRKHTKLVEDKQIHKYLREFQIVKERSSRDSYKSLKRSIMAKLNMHHRNPTYRTLSHAILPMMAVGLPTMKESSIPDTETARPLRRASFQVSAFRPVNSVTNGRGRRASELDINLINSRLSARQFGNGSREELTLERYGSFRGYQKSGEHLLPSKIEEEVPPSGSNDSTVVDMEEDEVSDPLDASRRTSVQSSISRSPVRDLEPNERYYYKPISISKACRVYEIPKNPQTNNSIKPVGIHVPLFKPSVTKSDRPKAAHSDTLDNIQDRGQESGAQMEYHNKCKDLTGTTNPPEPNISNNYKTDNGEGEGSKLNVSKGNSDNEKTNIIEAQTHKMPLPVSNGELGKPVQTRMPPLGSPLVRDGEESSLPGRRFSDKGPIDCPLDRKINVEETCLMGPLTHLNDIDNIRDEIQLDPHERNQRPVSSGGDAPDTKPSLHLDVVVSVHQWTNRSQPAPTSISTISTSSKYSKKHSKDYRGPSWPSPVQSPQHNKKGGSSPTGKKAFTTTVSSPTGKETPSTPGTRSIPCTESCESVSFPSDNSSDSDDVWLVMSNSRYNQQDTPASSDDLNYRPSFPELALRSAGTSPLLTPKDLRRFDSTDSTKRTSPRSLSSRSNSPANSQNGSDTEKLLHQVTSV